MESFIVCVNAVLPLFLVILLGYSARKLGDLSEADVFHFNSIAYKYFLPVLVFNNVYKSDLSIAFNGKLVRFVIFAVLLEWLISTLIVLRFEKNQSAVVF